FRQTIAYGREPLPSPLRADAVRPRGDDGVARAGRKPAGQKPLGGPPPRPAVHREDRPAARAPDARLRSEVERQVERRARPFVEARVRQEPLETERGEPEPPSRRRQQVEESDPRI